MSTTISSAQSGINYPMLHYNGWDDIVTASNDEHFQKNISEISQRFSMIFSVAAFAALYSI